jgi:hypothetical protein
MRFALSFLKKIKVLKKNFNLNSYYENNLLLYEAVNFNRHRLPPTYSVPCRLTTLPLFGDRHFSRNGACHLSPRQSHAKFAKANLPFF